MELELLGSVFLILALALVVGLFISQPFLGRAPVFRIPISDARQQREHERSSLLAERDRVLTALQELDFDYALGKVPQDDYPVHRGQLLKKGADILRRLDELQPQQPRTSEPAAAEVISDGMIEDRIEAAVAARRADARAGMTSQAAVPARATSGTNGKPVGGRQADPLEDVIASRKRERKESAAGFCPHCGRPVQKSDKFCSKCGTIL